MVSSRPIETSDGKAVLGRSIAIWWPCGLPASIKTAGLSSDWTVCSTKKKETALKRERKSRREENETGVKRQKESRKEEGGLRKEGEGKEEGRRKRQL
jgi:hypothetical protein